MPKTTERGILSKAIRNGKAMLGALSDAYDSGNKARMTAALELSHEFIHDVDGVVKPLLEAAASANSNGSSEMERSGEFS